MLSEPKSIDSWNVWVKQKKINRFMKCMGKTKEKQ